MYTVHAMLREDAEGVVLTVRVKPRARRNAIIGVRNDALLVEVTAPPEQNKANDAVIALLAEALNISKSRVELLSGQTHRDKRLRIWGLTPSQCWERLQVVLGQRP
uniref:UPF0235 protein HGMM_F04A11C29 n=2 Tax=Candidatus Bipolaricaulota TaxID=67810 RepID=H5SA25_9BACT|nr:hypothetical conserved protein [uncultured Acetothermia bacterium]BAL60183.1 hypothetical conserved protein [Candidatus Acetothermum autotrophicum]